MYCLNFSIEGDAMFKVLDSTMLVFSLFITRAHELCQSKPKADTLISFPSRIGCAHALIKLLCCHKGETSCQTSPQIRLPESGTLFVERQKKENGKHPERYARSSLINVPFENIYWDICQGPKGSTGLDKWCRWKSLCTLWGSTWRKKCTSGIY